MNTTDAPKINVINRIASIIMDHFCMTFVVMLFFLPMFISTFEVDLNSRNEHDFGYAFEGPIFYFMLLGLALYFCKDVINGRSIAKRNLKFQIVQIKNGLPVNPLWSLIRNLSFILWPLEVIFVFINPERRLGDYIAGTKLVKFDKTTEQPKVKILQVAITILAAYAVLLFLFSL